MATHELVQFTLPDILAKWPWPERISPHYEEVKEETRIWTHSLKPFDAKSKKHFDECDFTLLAALSNPTQDKERYWTCAAVMIVFWMFDDHSDAVNVAGVKYFKNIMMDALHNPHKPRPAGEHFLGEMIRQFWERAIQTTTPIAQERFIKETDEFLDAVVGQAAERETGQRETFEEFLALRHLTSGVKPSFIGLQLAMSIPDETYYHPAVHKIRDWAIDLILLNNDMCSFNKEQACGDFHNTISFLMRNQSMSIDEAMNWLSKRHAITVEAIFRCLEEELPWKIGTGTEIALYIEGLLNWVRADNSWSFKTQRYFGDKGMEIKHSRRVTLLPRQEPFIAN